MPMRLLLPLGLLACTLMALLLSLTPLRAEVRDQVTAYVFWQEGCPFCKQARAALDDMARTNPALRLNTVELGISAQNNALFAAAVDHFQIETPAVPLVVIGDQHALGFSGDGRSVARYARMIAECRAGPCPDFTTTVPNGAPQIQPPAQPSVNDIPDAVSVPILGDVDLHGLSLPLVTIVLAGVDGFNPCAMWVLALLIGLLLGVRDTRRMWTLGAVFLLATGAMYFAVMAAWLNVVLWIGAVAWLRIAIGLLAIGAGIYYLRDYWTNPEGICRVTPSGNRKTISDAFRHMVEQPSLLVAALGVAMLAIGVNLIELVCSAGIPAVFTQVLAMHDLSPAQHYGYILLYLVVFLLDDAVLFVIAMLTLRSAVTTGRYSRAAHLIGGVVLLVLGAVMVLRPDLLA
ncbi:glutaredoxin family protein [Phaeobacter marinintestinus]|uniref:glutaredoxin family protein n=1 Tax=Falsiphaeobacter marinintestinus TaxID=1492905 RepID=UPI0011B63A28|nr:hypothetical protein [Phaeobacter marinintestinus]